MFTKLLQEKSSQIKIACKCTVTRTGRMSPDHLIFHNKLTTFFFNIFFFYSKIEILRELSLLKNNFLFTSFLTSGSHTIPVLLLLVRIFGWRTYSYLTLIPYVLLDALNKMAKNRQLTCNQGLRPPPNQNCVTFYQIFF